MRLLAAYGLVAVVVVVPVDALGAGGPGPFGRALVATAGEGFVLDRRGEVFQVGQDGELAATASLDRYSTPFGTTVAGRAVFGGVRCDGDECDHRVAELAVLDDHGHIATRLPVTRSDGWPTRLDGLALVVPTTPATTTGPTLPALSDDGPVDGRSTLLGDEAGGGEGAGLVGEGGGGASGGGGGRGQDGVVWVNGGGSLHEVAVDRSTGAARVVDEVPWPGGEPCVIGGEIHDLVATGGIADRQGSWLGEGTTPPFRLVLRRWTGERWQRVPGGATTMANGQNAYCTGDGYEIRDGLGPLAGWTPAGGWRPRVSPALPRTSAAASDRPPGKPRAVDHYNMCSAACGPGVRPRTRDLVARLVELNRPAALSLNEACYDDAVHLSGRLTTVVAMAGYSALDRAVGCPGAVKRYGNIVMVGAGLDPGTAWWGAFSSQAEPPCDHRIHECRGMVCVAAERVFCSAHLESPRRDADVAEAQASEYVAAVDARFGTDVSRVLAGDFNVGRSTTDDVFGPAGYSAPQPATTVGPSVGGDEIDRIYDDAVTGSAGGVTRYCEPQASDHCYLTTAAPVTASSPIV